MTNEERKLLDKLSSMEFEESLEVWLNSPSEEDREAFLNEDWSEFDNVK